MLGEHQLKQRPGIHFRRCTMPFEQQGGKERRKKGQIFCNQWICVEILTFCMNNDIIGKITRDHIYLGEEHVLVHKVYRNETADHCGWLRTSMAECVRHSASVAGGSVAVYGCRQNDSVARHIYPLQSPI